MIALLFICLLAIYSCFEGVDTSCEKGRVSEWSDMLEKYGSLEDWKDNETYPVIRSNSALLHYKIEAQYNKPIWRYGNPNPFNNEDYIMFDSIGGHGECRMPMEWIIDFLATSPIDRWNSNSNPDIPLFSCTDFAIALY